MSPIFRNLGKIPEETAHVLQNLVSAKGFRIVMCNHKVNVVACIRVVGHYL